MAQVVHKNNLNMTFSWLEVILIVMVVDDHASSAVGALTGIFPYDSFFMPAFVFVSGYFYACSTLGAFVRKKLKKQFGPYLAWCGIGVMVSYLVDKTMGFSWLNAIRNVPVSRVVVSTLLIGPLTSANGAAWFLVMLFYLEIIYAILQTTILLENRTRNYAALWAILATAIGSVALCMRGFSTNIFACFVFREIFYLVFFHAGHMFKLYWEGYLHEMSQPRVCGACFLTNVILIGLFGDIRFPSTMDMRTFHSCVLPFVSSVTGTLFWYEIASTLARAGESHVIGWLSRNTDVVMQTHLVGECIPVFIALFITRMTPQAMLTQEEIQHAALGAGAHVAKAIHPIIMFSSGIAFSLIVIMIIDYVSKRIEHQSSE